ncbi:hypothetical protein JCM8547_004064 [Rhodosporidiobolus lusitaniae]
MTPARPDRRPEASERPMVSQLGGINEEDDGERGGGSREHDSFLSAPPRPLPRHSAANSRFSSLRRPALLDTQLLRQQRHYSSGSGESSGAGSGSETESEAPSPIMARPHPLDEQRKKQRQHGGTLEEMFPDAAGGRALHHDSSGSDSETPHRNPLLHRSSFSPRPARLHSRHSDASSDDEEHLPVRRRDSRTHLPVYTDFISFDSYGEPVLTDSFLSGFGQPRPSPSKEEDAEALKKRSFLQALKEAPSDFGKYLKDKKEGIKEGLKAFRKLPRMTRSVLWGLFILAVGASLDNTTVYQFVTYATSSFDDHSALGMVLTAQGIATAFFRPVATKESLLLGLFAAFGVSLVLYVAGYVCMAVSPTVEVYAAGSTIAQLGIAAFISLNSTALFTYMAGLGNNAFLNSLLSVPYWFTGWGASFIVDLVLNHLSWRWGYGLFAIVMPFFCAPLLVFLFVDERQKRKAKASLASPSPEHDDEDQPRGRSPRRSSTSSSSSHHRAVTTALALGHLRSRAPPSPSRSIHDPTHPRTAPSSKWIPSRAAIKSARKKVISGDSHLGKLDALGLVFMAVALAGLLMPFTLVGNGHITWSSPVFYGMLIGGGIGFVLFVVNEVCWTKHPIFPLSVFRKRRTVVALLATFLNMMSFFLLLTYQYSFIQVTHPSWSTKVQGFFAFSEQFTLTAVHLIASKPIAKIVKLQTAAQRMGTLHGKDKGLLRQPMWWTCFAHGTRVLGVGLMIEGRKLNGWVWLLIVSQVIHGIGGAFASVYVIQILMASVSSVNDISMIWALCLLVGDIGNSVGTAMSTLLWKHFLPLRLAANLDGLLSSDEITEVFDSTAKAISYEEGSDILIGIQTAYVEVMRYLLWAALAIASLSFLSSFLIGDANVAEKEAPAKEEEDEPALPAADSTSTSSVQSGPEDESSRIRKPLPTMLDRPKPLQTWRRYPQYPNLEELFPGEVSPTFDTRRC